MTREDAQRWALIIAFFRAFPDILLDMFESDDCEFRNSLMTRLVLRARARNAVTFIYACRGFGKTTGTIASRCTAGILWPGEITGYYAPVEKQSAPLAGKAFATYERNWPYLASHWKRTSDARQHFRIETRHGSRLIMDIDRGMDTSCVVAEECGQEDKNPFNWEEFNQIVLGTNRKQYNRFGRPDPTHLDFQEHYITSATRRQNEAYAVCRKIRQEMAADERAFALWIPWQVPVLCRMKPFGYYEKLRKRLTAEQFMRECESICTGSTENPLIRDEALQGARCLKCMEEKHGGGKDTRYILGYDVSYRDAAGNALTAIAVLRTDPDPGEDGKLKKALVWVTDCPPPASAAEHSALIKRHWADYRRKGGEEPLLVIDARSYGKSVVERLHEDAGDGLPPLATITHEDPYRSLELPGAVSCIYPLQATGSSGRDPNTEMLDYIERELENGGLTLLTADVSEGARTFKLLHGIRDDERDAEIQLPYIKTGELCRQISNLRKKYTAGGWVEAEISGSIRKDMWSALLYAARMAQRLESESYYRRSRRENEWSREADRLSALPEARPNPRPLRWSGRKGIG